MYVLCLGIDLPSVWCARRPSGWTGVSLRPHSSGRRSTPASRRTIGGGSLRNRIVPLDSSADVPTFEPSVIEQAIRPAVVIRKDCGGNRTCHGPDIQPVLARLGGRCGRLGSGGRPSRRRERALQCVEDGGVGGTQHRGGQRGEVEISLAAPVGCVDRRVPRKGENGHELGGYVRGEAPGIVEPRRCVD